MTVKERIATVLRRLPDDCSLEEVQYHLYVLEKISRRLEQVDQEESIEQREVEERLRKWLA